MKTLIPLFGLILAVSVRAQDSPTPGEKPAPEKKAEPARTSDVEVRVYLEDKEKKAVDLAGISATLILESTPKTAPPGAADGRQAAKGGIMTKSFLMKIVTPQAPEKAWPHERESRAVEGGEYTCLLLVGTAGAKEKTSKEGDRSVLGKVRGLEEKLPGAKGDEAKGDEESTVPAGPYFMASLSGDLAASDWSAVVSFVIKGDTKSAGGFRISSKSGSGTSSTFLAPLDTLEKDIRNGDWTKAAVTAEGLAASTKLLGAKDETHASLWQEVKSAVDAKDSSKALDAIQKLRAHLTGGGK